MSVRRAVMVRFRTSASVSAWSGGRAVRRAVSVVGGRGRVRVGVAVRRVTAERRTWGWAWERSGVVREVGIEREGFLEAWSSTEEKWNQWGGFIYWIVAGVGT